MEDVLYMAFAGGPRSVLQAKRSQENTMDPSMHRRRTLAPFHDRFPCL